MSDPQDLLYTNKFISNDIINNDKLLSETKYYDRFKNYISGNLTDDTNSYIDKDQYESSDINIDKTLNTKWPIYSNKNHYPLFDTYTNDISSNRYKKEIITKINVDNRNRNISLYPNPNSFTIQFSRVFNNVNKMVLNDIIFKNVNQSITNVNNNLAWQYASEDYLFSNNIDNSIIPVPDINNQISYSSLPNAVFSYNSSSGTTSKIEKYLTYQTSIPPGFYNTNTLIDKINLYTSQVLHGSSAAIPNDIISEQPYIAAPKRINTPHLFSCSIDPLTSIVRFVNRIEKAKIAAIQTFSPYETNFSNVDIFHYFSSQYASNNNYVLNTDFIYVLMPPSNTSLQYYKNISCIYSPNPFPLVITDLDKPIGNLNPELINYTEFYDIEIYLQNGYTEEQLQSVSYYKYVDTITIPNSNPLIANGIVKNSVYTRFALSLSNGNINGNNYDSNGQRIIPSDTRNIIFSLNLNKIIQLYGNVSSVNTASGTFNTVYTTPSAPPNITNINTQYTNINYTSGINGEYLFFDQLVYIGRALLFRWIYDLKGDTYITYEFDTENEKKRSLLHLLAWPITNTTKEIYAIQQNEGFRFVHTNYQSQIVDKNLLNSYQIYSSNRFPSYSLNLQIFSNNYYFISNNYIYLKIYFDSHENITQGDEYINTVSLQTLQYDQVYINSLVFDVGIGQDYTCLNNSQYLTTYKKDQSHIFAKILLSEISGNIDINISNIINNNSYYTYYDNVKDKIEYITVEVYDANMKLLFINNNFSFTVNIHEVKDVLKETLINSRNNNVTTTGHII